MFKIAFIEDNEVYLNLLQSSMQQAPDMEVVIAANSAEDFWKKLPENVALDVIFVDLGLPGASGLVLLSRLKQCFGQAELIVLTQHDDRDTLFKALNVGASGYLLKDISLPRLPDFIRRLPEGEALVAPKMARWLVQYFQVSALPSPSDLISAKEFQLLCLFADGFTYGEAADSLGLTIDGVRYHVKNIYKKLNVNNKLEAIRLVLQQKNK